VPLWWIGNAVLLLVVAPVVATLLRGVLLATHRIDGELKAIAQAAPALLDDLEAVPALLDTASLVHRTTAGLARYGAALEQVLQEE
jgi:hypothetical protein